MAKLSLLVADADPRSLRILEVALRKAGFAVATAADGGEALRRIQRIAPDLVLCEAALPVQDGLAVCRAVRADERIAGMPFVVMSANKLVQARATEAGADDFLAKPLLIKELVTRLRLLLERREKQRNAQRESPAALTGAVGDLGLVDLFQSLENWRKSATVSCESEGRKATVWVRDGQVIDAAVAPVTGEAAFYRLLNWETGTFRVEFGPVGRDEQISLGTAGLLVEAMRRVDELERAAEALPLSTRLAVDFAALAQRLGELPDEVNGILKLFDGQRPLVEALAASPLDELSTLAVVQRLLADGVLSQDGKPRKPQKPSLQQWLGAAAPVSAPPPPRSNYAFSPDDAPFLAAPAVDAAAQTAPSGDAPSAPALVEPSAALDAPSAPALDAPSAPALDAPSAPAMDAPSAAVLVEAPDFAGAAADLARAMADAEAAEAQRALEAEESAARTLAARPPAGEPAAAALALVRFPPLRGVRRERLRREAEEAKAQIAAGQVLRLSRVVELPAFRPGDADALGPQVRRMSPAVGEAAKKFAPDLPVSALQPADARLRQVPLSELDTDPGFRAPAAVADASASRVEAVADASASRAEAVGVGALEATVAGPAAAPGFADSAEETAVLAASRGGDEVAGAAEAQADGDGAPHAGEGARHVALEAAAQAAGEAAAFVAGVGAASGAGATPARAVAAPVAQEGAVDSATLPIAAEAAVAGAAPPAAVATSAAAGDAFPAAVDAPPAVGDAPPAVGDAPPAVGDAPAVAVEAAPHGEGATAAGAVQQALLTPAPGGPAPLPGGSAARSEDEEFEADLRAALGGRRRRWPWAVGAAAAAAALLLLLRPQPATDKKDSPWLEGAASASPAAAKTAPAGAPPAAAPAANPTAVAGATPTAPTAVPPTPTPMVATPAPAVATTAAPAPTAPPAATAAPAPTAAPAATAAPAPIAPPAPTPPAPAAAPAVAAASLVPSPETDDYARALDTGEKLLKRGRYRQAVAEFKVAVQHNPESVPALLALGDAWLEADAPRNALKPLQKAATLDPRSGRAQLLLGTAWQSLGKNKDAIAAYQRYLLLEPSGEFAHDVRSILANLAP